MESLKIDHRVRVTKVLIRNAFTSLLREKPIQSITIREICERSGINRSTFYKHYADIHELLVKLEDEMFGEFKAAIDPLLAEIGQSDSLRLSTRVFQVLRDNSDLCIVTLGDYGDKDFALRLLSYGRQKMVEAYLRQFGNVSTQELEYFYAFASAGCIGLMRKWFEDGMKLSAEQIAQMAESMIYQGSAFMLNRG